MMLPDTDSCIRVRFIADRGFIGSSIRWFTNSLFQHVEFGTPQGTWIGAHASLGVQERAADYCHPFREYVYEIPASTWTSSTLMTWCRAKIGTEYNYWTIAGLLLRSRKLDSPGRLMCAQFCTEGLLQAYGGRRVLNVLPDYSFLVTPEMLHLSPIFYGNLKAKVDSPHKAAGQGIEAGGPSR